MRNALLLMVSLFLLTACEGINDSLGDYGGGNNRYNGSNYNNNNYNGYGNDYGYSNYYPYGTPNYPRDNIYWIDGYHPCSGYVYQGYCYRDKHDLQAAIYWDQQHGRDENWHRKRHEWCEEHDCNRNHETHGHDINGATVDANGKPLEQHVERDGEPQQIHPDPMPRQPRYPSGGYQSGNYSSHNYPSHDFSQEPAPRSSGDDNGRQVQQYRQQRVEPVQQQSGDSSHHVRQIQQQPVRVEQKPQGSQETNSQGRPHEINVTPE